MLQIFFKNFKNIFAFIPIFSASFNGSNIGVLPIISLILLYIFFMPCLPFSFRDYIIKNFSIIKLSLSKTAYVSDTISLKTAPAITNPHAPGTNDMLPIAVLRVLTGSSFE